MIASLRSDLKAVTLERDAAVHELLRLRGSAACRRNPPVSPRPEGTEVRPPAITMTELPSAARLPAFSNGAFSNTAVPRIESPAPGKLAGFWFYAKPPLGQRNKNQSLYPPQYIEVTINEEGASSMAGTALASRWLIGRSLPTSISPSPGLRTPDPKSGFSWTGSGGAKGELTLKLVSENSMKIDWTATELGTQLGLEGGTAVLTRRIE